MALIALVTADKVQIVGIPAQQHTFVAGEAITAGAPVYLKSDGLAWNAIGTGAGTAQAWGIADRTVAAGENVTVIKRGKMDGWDFSSQAYDAKIFVSDTSGRLGDAAGTNTFQIGRVVAAYGTNLGTSPDKILQVECA